jgi:hypothetical protein
MTAVSAALCRKWGELAEGRPGSDGRLSVVIGVSRSLLPAAGKFSIV